MILSTGARLHICVPSVEQALFWRLVAIVHPGATLTLNVHRVELAVTMVSVLMRSRRMGVIHCRVMVWTTVPVREGLLLAALAAEVDRRGWPTTTDRLVMIWQHVTCCSGLSRCCVQWLVEFLTKVCTLLIVLR